MVPPNLPLSSPIVGIGLCVIAFVWIGDCFPRPWGSPSTLGQRLLTRAVVSPPAGIGRRTWFETRSDSIFPSVEGIRLAFSFLLNLMQFDPQTRGWTR